MTTDQIQHRYLVELTDRRATARDAVGGKAAALARLAAAGFDVPEGLVLTTAAFTDALGEDPDPATVTSIPLPSSVEEALLKSIRRFGDATVAVRSSGLAEDLDDASYAGQYESVLGVKGVEALVDAVRTCWASAFSARVADYRRRRHSAVQPMAVLIQRQVDPIAAGVAFTADPVSGDRNVVVINAVSGLADGLMSGELTPEEWRVTETARRTSGPEEALTVDQAEAVAELATRISRHLGEPQDVEWALDDSGIRVLQARPITALPEEAIEPVPVPVEIPDGYWERIATHFPEPTSPLMGSIFYPIANQATADMATVNGLLLDGVQQIEIGGWTYLRTVPFGGKDRKPPPSWLAKIMVRLHPGMRKRVRTAAEAFRNDREGRVIQQWYDEWMPHFAQRAAQLGAIHLPALADEELVSHWMERVALLKDGLETHFLHLFPAMMLGVYNLIATTDELLGWDAANALELVRGLSQRSTEPGRRLFELAAMAFERSRVRELLEHIDTTTVSRLEQVDPEFAARFEEYRQEYGVVCLSRDIKDPSMGERPELLLHLVANQVAAGFDPAVTAQGNDSQRATVLADARQRLADRSGEQRRRFETALRRAERAYPIREDNLFYVLFTPMGLIRQAALEMGKRLTERDQIERSSDVFYLREDELTDAVTTGDRLEDLVARRRGEEAWVLAHPGPASYGEAPGEPPSVDFLPAEARHATNALLALIDLTMGHHDHTPGDGAILAGIAASAGRYTGTVRVIHNEREFDKLRAGDVLVCPMTSPTWSVLFPSVGALVTDAGGILNHPAIIAREYRIPAVVATGDATERLVDGQTVTVDGSAGTVEAT